MEHRKGFLLFAHCVLTVSLWGDGLTQDLPSHAAETNVDCETPQLQEFPAMFEGYEGTIEMFERPEGADLILESPSCPVCASFLALAPVRSPFATVITMKPLDAEALKENNGLLSYYVTCKNTGIKNPRTLPLIDINDHAPVFEQDVYQVDISESLPVDYKVVQVKATDADATPVYNTVTYSIEPQSDTFDITLEGWIVLKKSLDYTVTAYYALTVIAKDIEGKMDEATFMINVTDGLYFQHTLYNAYIPENEVDSLYGMHPDPIQALGADKEDDQIIYNISTVHPDQFRRHFGINSTTGVITVLKNLDHEEESMINVAIKASLENDSDRTATTTVIVEVTDMNEAPVFSQRVYEADVFSVVPNGYTVIVVKATDPDVGETETLQYSLVDPNPLFDIEPSSGQVYVTTSLKTEKMKSTVKLKALDTRRLEDTALVKVKIMPCENKNIATLSINVNHDDVQKNEEKVKEVLEIHISWNVTFIDIRPVKRYQPLQKASSYQTDIDIVAMVDTTQGPRILDDYAIVMRLGKYAPAIQEDLQAVFGPDVDFEVGPPGPDKGGTDITTIMLATLIPIVAVVIIAAFIHRASPHMRATLNGMITDTSTYMSQGTASSTHSNVSSGRISMHNGSIRAGSCPVGPLPCFSRPKHRPHVGVLFPSVFEKIAPPHRFGRSKQRPHAGEIFPNIVEHPEPELYHPSSVSQNARGLIDTRTSSPYLSQGTASSTHSNRSSDSMSTQNASLRGGSKLVGPFSEPMKRSVHDISHSVVHHPKPELNQHSSVSQNVSGLVDTSTSSAYVSQGTASSTHRSSGSTSSHNVNLRGGCTWVGPLSEPSQ